MIRRSLSIPVFVVTLASLTAAASGFHFVRQWQLTRLAQTFLVRAREAEERQEWLTAAEDLDRYLRFEPEHAAVRCQLAQVFTKGAATIDEKQRAVALHHRALATQPAGDDNGLRIQLAELLLETERWLEAEGEAQQILTALPDHPRALRVFALARFLQWRNGDLSSKNPGELGLLTSIESALRFKPEDIALAEFGATLYRDFPAMVKAHRAELSTVEAENRADALLDQAVERNPAKAEALLARHLYRAHHRLEGAQQDLSAALALEPDDPQVALIAAEDRFQQAQQALASTTTKHTANVPLAECKLLLQRLIDKKLMRDNAQPQLRLGDVWVLEGALDPALEVWRQGCELYSKPTIRVTFHARIADHMLSAGRLPEAKPSLDAIQEILDELGGTIRREDHLALLQAQGLRQARYDLCLGRYSAAVGRLERAIAQQPQLQPNLETSQAAWDLLGRGYAGLRDWAAAATAFDRAANFLPTVAGSRLAAAESWLAAGRTDLAIDRAEQVILIEDLPDARLVLATAELQVQSARPAAERMWGSLEEAFAALEKFKQGGGVIAAPWRVEFLEADYIALRAAADANENSAWVAAAEVLRRAETEYPDQSEFWFRVCLAYEQLAQPQDAERAWQRLSQLPGTETEMAIVAARRAAAHADYSKAASILESAAPSLPHAAQERLRQELIRIAQVKQDLPRMGALFRGILRQRPHDVEALCGLAELALREGDFSALEQWETSLARAGAAGEIWSQYFHITRLYTTATSPNDARLAEALTAHARLATIRPNWADTFSLRGAIEQRLEHFESAVAAYEQAVQLGERRYAIFEQLVTCLDRLHRGDDVDKYLARMQSYLPASQHLTELASGRQLADNQPERAIEIAQRALARRPQDLSARLWLARLLLITNHLPEAKAAITEATQSAPSDARSWQGLFAYYLRTGDHEQARQTLVSLQQHAQLKPDELAFVLGRAYAQLGDLPQALQLLTEVVQRNPNRPEAHLQIAKLLLETDRDQAKAHLRQAIALDPKLAQARWMLATLLSVGGSGDELAVAEQLLEHTGGATTVDDRRVRAVMLAQHGGDKGLASAIDMLEEITQSGSEAVLDRLLLAQFYERQAAATTDGATAKQLLKAARDQLVTVANRPRAAAADIGALISLLLRHDDYRSEAAVWLDRLEERMERQATADPKAVAQLIDLRIEQGEVQRCEPWLVRLDAIDRDPFRPLVARVKYYAALPQVDAIEPAVESKAGDLYRAAKSPLEQSRIARTIGDLYLHVHQFEGAERWYRIVAQADPEQFPLLAMALMRQGRGQEAIRLCQAAAESDTGSRPAVVLTSLLLESGALPEYMQLAEPILAKALENFPDDVNLLYGVGMLRVFEDRYPTAIVLLRRVIELNQRHIPALNNLAMLIAESETTRPEGLALVERAIAHRGHEATLLDTKGTILMLAGQTNEAVKLLEAAARGSATDPRHSFHLALAYCELGSINDASRELAIAIDNNLEKQILTPTDRKALIKLRSDVAGAAAPSL